MTKKGEVLDKKAPLIQTGWESLFLLLNKRWRVSFLVDLYNNLNKTYLISREK